MVNYTCAWGLCQNTRQKNPTLRFIPFIKPFGRFPDRICADRWVWLCGRKNFTVDDITHNTYICAEHFDNYENVEDLNPRKNQRLEPYPATSKTSKAPKFVPTKANTITPRPKIPQDLHEVETVNSEEKFKNVKTFSKPKVTTIEVPYGVKNFVTPSKINAAHSSYISPKQIRILGKRPMDYVQSASTENDTAEEILETIELTGM